MQGQAGFFDFDDRLKRLSEFGDQLEAFRIAVDFELFRSELNAALAYSDGSEGGRHHSVCPGAAARNRPRRRHKGRAYPT